ncbi:MAG: A/G-specific adenine glycosylase, partial [Halodesulfurarchaeum sp.]
MGESAGSDQPTEESKPDWDLPADLDAVRSTLLEWYEDGHRALPWRETTDPYEILVAEVMSQQTQLDRVVEPWEEFLDRWPTVEALAAADRSAVVSFWTAHNLGYNNRARYLHQAATQVVEDHGGEVPEDPEGLTNLMGVGPYTANAVASFAFNAGGAVVDTNVKRILHRAFDIPDDDAAFEGAAGRLMPEGRSRQWNNAIMELGGVACTPAPSCDGADCPWRRWCAAYR